MATQFDPNEPVRIAHSLFELMQCFVSLADPVVSDEPTIRIKFESGLKRLEQIRTPFIRDAYRVGLYVETVDKTYASVLGACRSIEDQVLPRLVCPFLDDHCMRFFRGFMGESRFPTLGESWELLTKHNSHLLHHGSEILLPPVDELSQVSDILSVIKGHRRSKQFVSASELAEITGMSLEAVNGRLKRLPTHVQEEIRHELKNRRKGDPLYLWRFAEVLPILIGR